ncbi:response regulator transcription factor [Anaerosporobacter faecicola]|uniref:response regulator transcription factor n=1 Tax=Anaerosporobacter faecicola TaxID=2718714 RepID=UPI0014387C0A|nr:response regulator transcription factor [Anaerosporobacter faecicola]
MEKYRIAIVEDDKTIREELGYILENQGYEVKYVQEFQYIEEQIRQMNPHLILLDINLPQEDGYHVCMRIRRFSSVPIIFVTSRNTDMDELQSLTLGGDDYITKPYNTSILLARIEKLIRRVYHEKAKEEKLIHKGVELQVETAKLQYGEKQVTLTRNELCIMIYLFRHAGKICARTDLIDYLWDHEGFIDDNALSVNITRIRGKLAQLGIHDFIETKHRQGYLI